MTERLTSTKQLREEILKIAKKFAVDAPEFTIRADGRIELYCEHGVGHPSPRLTKLWRGVWNQYDGIHGCDGCCSKIQLVVFEMEP